LKNSTLRSVKGMNFACIVKRCVIISVCISYAQMSVTCLYLFFIKKIRAD